MYRIRSDIKNGVMYWSEIRMIEIDDEVTHLIEAVKQSRTYREYDKQRNLVNEDAELKESIDRYRVENFQLQNAPDDGNIKYRLEEFADKYADFLEDPRVSAFLDAENNLCKMMQELTDRVVESLNFE